jgi:uncharacterized membrane protein
MRDPIISDQHAAQRSMRPGVTIGIGLGGLVDGIALHQIAQWHSMGSAKLPPTTIDAIRQNMGWDGWFHAAMLVLTITGIYGLLREANGGRLLPEAVPFTGQLLLGWGAFNLVEGILDHHILEIHHVRDMPVHLPAYDWIYLGVGGLALLILGWFLSHARGVATPSRHQRNAAAQPRGPNA